MGMYTGIRFKGYVKPEFREDFENIALNGEWESSRDSILQSFSSFYRASFIPCGSLSYMPDEWEGHDNRYKEYSWEWFDSAKDAGGFNRTWNKETGYWTFQCSLKNYESEIEAWFDILPHFIEKIEHLEYFYEEWDCSCRYDLINNEIKCVDTEFIKYNR